METALDRIVASVRAGLAGRKQTAIKRGPFYRRKPGDFMEALAAAPTAVIAEVKFSSPSEGALRSAPSSAAAVKIAGSYLSAGASALSILTEPDYFKGKPEFLAAVRRRYPEALLLMKDFVVDPRQLELARAIGADAVLLIAACLGRELKGLFKKAAGLGLTPLVEVHTAAELSLARAAGAKLIGVNSRNLKTLKTDLRVAKDLIKAGVGPGELWVAESGIKSAGDVAALAACGYGAFLVGTELMRAQDPGAALRGLLRPSEAVGGSDDAP